MSLELFDAAEIKKLLKAQGRSRQWLIDQAELGADGYRILRGETLPKDPERKSRVTRKVASLLGVEVRQILLRFKAERKTA